jgi:hypothetical protein
LVFHLTAVLCSEVAGQVNYSRLEFDIGKCFWWYCILIHQDVAHSYFAPEPDPATPVVTARLTFSGNTPDRRIRLPDPSLRPRIRFIRQIALAWHLVHEWTEDETPHRSYWAASYARHLCRTNPGCTRVDLFVEYHQMAQPRMILDAASRGAKVDLDSLESYSLPERIGAFSCDEF